MVARCTWCDWLMAGGWLCSGKCGLQWNVGVMAGPHVMNVSKYRWRVFACVETVQV